MCFTEDLESLQNVFNAIDKLLENEKKRPTVPPLSIISLHAVLLRLVRRYKYAVRDANAILEHLDCVGECDGYLKHKMDGILKNTSARGLSAVLCHTGDLVQMLLELDNRYETLVKPLAAAAVRTMPMVYDREFEYTAPVWDPYATGPGAKMDTLLSNVYGMWYTNDHFKPIDGILTWWWRPSFPMFTYNQGMFFGPTTRTTQMTCFTFADARLKLCDTHEIVHRSNKYVIFYGLSVYEPHTQELTHWSDTDRYGYRFPVMCEESGTDDNETRVSLAASISRHRNALYGIHVVKINWIDATNMKNDKLRYSKNVLYGTKHSITPLRRGPFPYDTLSSYRTWHVVLGNGCKIKVRVTYIYENSTWKSTTNYRWTLTNTDGHVEFDESAHMLQKYYGFQARSGVVHPLDRISTDAFVVANQRRIHNLEWLVNARIERPSTAGTPPIRFADKRISQLLHAIVLNSIHCRQVEYFRFDTVSSV